MSTCLKQHIVSKSIGKQMTKGNDVYGIVRPYPFFFLFSPDTINSLFQLAVCNWIAEQNAVQRANDSRRRVHLSQYYYGVVQNQLRNKAVFGISWVCLRSWRKFNALTLRRGHYWKSEDKAVEISYTMCKLESVQFYKANFHITWKSFSLGDGNGGEGCVNATLISTTSENAFIVLVLRVKPKSVFHFFSGVVRWVLAFFRVC